MGFTTGLLSGATLTYTLLYLTLHIHRRNRYSQHTALSQSSLLLNTLIDPIPPPAEPPAYTLRRPSMAERLKDRWNREIAETTGRVQRHDWNEFRHDWEVFLREAWVGVVDYTAEQSGPSGGVAGGVDGEGSGRRLLEISGGGAGVGSTGKESEGGGKRLLEIR